MFLYLDFRAICNYPFHNPNFVPYLCFVEFTYLKSFCLFDFIFCFCSLEDLPKPLTTYINNYELMELLCFLFDFCFIDSFILESFK